MILVFIFLFLFLVLAFHDLSSLRTHFWPFTPFLRKILPGVAKKFGGLGVQPQITRMTRIYRQSEKTENLQPTRIRKAWWLASTSATSEDLLPEAFLIFVVFC